MSCINLYKKHWEGEPIVRKIFLKYWKANLNESGAFIAEIAERKKIIHFVLIDFLMGGSEFIETLEAYCRVFECKELSASLNSYKNQICSLPKKVNLTEEKDVQESLDKEASEESIKNVLGEIQSRRILSEQQRDRQVDIFLDGLNDDFLIKNADDLLTCLIEMELYESALKFINNMRNKIKKENVEEQINMAYLEIIALEKSGKHYQAMDRIEDTLSLLPFAREESEAFHKKKENLMKKINLFKGNI